jgi:superfamily II DNA/RNA helicase
MLGLAEKIFVIIYVRKLDSFPHIVVGTPGCVSALIAKKTLKTQFIKTIVLDEADRLLISEKVEIKNLLKFFEEDIQVILLSKLMSKDVLDESTHFVNNPIHILEQNKELAFDGILKKLIFSLVHFN